MARQLAGLVVGAQSTGLGFERSGKVSALAVDDGELVVAGQLLGSLDTRVLEAELAQLRGRVDELSSQLALNHANQQRNDELMARGFTSRQRADELASEDKALSARLQQVEASIRANEARLDQSSMYAPYDATVSRRFVDEGAVVAAGEPAFLLLQASSSEARIGVPARLLGDLALGDELTLEVAGRQTTGRLVSIGDSISAATLTVPVRISLADAVAAVPGEQVYLVMDETVPTPGYWVPLEALTDGLRGLWNVYVGLPNGQADGEYTLQARDVRVLYANEHQAYVTGALDPQALIVAEGVQRLVPGQQAVAAQRLVAQRP